MSQASEGESVTICYILGSNYFTLTLKGLMKKSLQLSLAVLAVSVLTACGSGGSEDAADKYVGTWKSVCVSYVATNGSTYYTHRIRTFAKSNATVLTGTFKSENVYLDTACKQLYATSVTNHNPENLNIGSKVAFLGQSVDSIVLTDTVTGTTYPGYATADNTQLLIVTPAAGQTATGWGVNSPYTKQ